VNARGGRRALVTGATGYVGAHVVRELLRSGWSVAAIARPASSTTLLGDDAARVTFHRDDGNDDALGRFVRAAAPDVVIHLAALYIAAPQEVDRPALETANLGFARRLGVALAGSGARGIVAAASHLQMRPDSDDAEPAPRGLYALSKQAGEDALAQIAAEARMTFTALVLFDTYGPADPRRKLFDLLADAAGRTEPFAMSPGEQRLDLVWIGDAAAAFVAAAARVADGMARGRERFAVTAAERLRLRDVVAAWQSVTGHTLEIAWGALPYRPHEPMAPWRGRSLPGWHARVPLVEGIARLALPRPREGS